MSTTTLPPNAFDGLLPKLITILELSQRPEGTITPQARQALLQAVRCSPRPPLPGTSAHITAVQTNDFKESISHAKDLANALPGGELNADEQDEIIAMLEEMRDHKRYAVVTPELCALLAECRHCRRQLAEFSARAVSTGYGGGEEKEIKMEVDSTASTPGA